MLLSSARRAGQYYDIRKPSREAVFLCPENTHPLHRNQSPVCFERPSSEGFFLEPSLMDEVESARRDGLQQGQLLALENMFASQQTRLDKVEGRVSVLERVSYTLIGAIALVQFVPALKAALTS